MEKQVVEVLSPDVGSLIYMVRNKQVMVDSDLAMLYQVETKALNRAVKRNAKRFPEDFCFQLTAEELKILRGPIWHRKIKGSRNGRWTWRQTHLTICIYRTGKIYP